VFTAQYALSPYIKQIRFVFKGLREMRSITDVYLNFSMKVTHKYIHICNIYNIYIPKINQMAVILQNNDSLLTHKKYIQKSDQNTVIL
jgi:hypothetical protein